MIKAIIVDVDGILVGEKIGFNSPYPHAKILHTLKNLRERNIPIILCTAKPYFSIRDSIIGAQLNNIHSTDSGAVLIEPIDKKFLEISVLEKTIVKGILQALLNENIYTEFYWEICS